MIYLRKVPKKIYQNYRAYGLTMSDNPEDEKQYKNAPLFSRELPLSRPDIANYFCLIELDNPNEKNEIIGTISYRHTGSITKLRDIHIEEDYRTQGYGTQVMMLLIEQAMSANSLLIWLFVFFHRKPAILLYEKLGFKSINEMDNGIEMTLELSKYWIGTEL